MPAVPLEGDELVLHLMIQPKASRDQIIGLHGDELKVAITAPPVDGQANSHLIWYPGQAVQRWPRGRFASCGGAGSAQDGRHRRAKADPAEIAALLDNQGVDTRG